MGVEAPAENRTSMFALGRRLEGTPGQALFGATLGFFVGFAAVALFGPTAAKFQAVMKLSPTSIGLLVAIPSLSGSLLRIPFSAWVDVSGGRKPFLVLLSLAVIGMLGLFLVVTFLYPSRLSADLFPVLLVLGALCGCGIASFSVGISQVSYWFPQRQQGQALGTFGGVGNLAPGLFSFLLPVAMGSVGLAGSYLAWLLFLVAGTILYALLGRNNWYFQLKSQGVPGEFAAREARRLGQEVFPSQDIIMSLIFSAKVAKTWLLVAVYFTTFGGFTALTAWLPVYWTSFFTLAVVTAGLLTALFSVLASLTRVVGGAFADRLGGANTLILALLAMLVGSVVMIFSHQVATSAVAEVVMALGMGASNAAVFKLVPQEVPRAVGGAAGWVGGLGAFGGFAIPPLLGIMVHMQGAAGYAQGFVIFSGLAAFSLVLAYRIAVPRRSPSSQFS